MDLFVQEIVGGVLVSIPSPLFIMLSFIFLLFGCGLKSILILRKKQNKLLSEVDNLRENTKGLVVEEIVQEYNDSIMAGNENVNTFAILSKVYVKHIIQYRFSKIEFDLEKTVGFCINALVILGLIGTFLGLSQTLYEIKEILSVLKQGGSNQQNAQAMDFFGNIIDSLTVPLSKMSTAFVASLMGISLSLGLNLLAHCLRIEEKKQSIFNELEDYLDNYYQPRARKNTTTRLMENQNQLLKNFLTDFSKTMEQGFSRSIDKLTSSIGNVTESIKNTMEGFSLFLQDHFSKVVQEIGKQNKSTMSKIDIVITSLDNVVGEFQNGVQYLEKVGNRFENYVLDMTTSTNTLHNEVLNLKYSIFQLKEAVRDLVTKTDTIGSSLQQMSQGVEETLQKAIETQQAFVHSSRKVRQEQNEQILKLFEQMENVMLDRFDKSTAIMMSKIQDGHNATLAQTNSLFKDLSGSFEKSIEEMHYRITEIHVGSQDRIIRAVAGMQKEMFTEISNISNNLINSVTDMSKDFDRMVKTSEAALTLVIKDWSVGVYDLIHKTKDSMTSLQQSIDYIKPEFDNSINILTKHVKDLNNSVMKNTADYLDKVYALAVNAEQTVTNTMETWSNRASQSAAATDKQLSKLANSFEIVEKSLVSLNNETLNSLSKEIANMDKTISTGFKDFKSISCETGKMVSDLQTNFQVNIKEMSGLKSVLETKIEGINTSEQFKKVVKKPEEDNEVLLEDAKQSMRNNEKPVRWRQSNKAGENRVFRVKTNE